MIAFSLDLFVLGMCNSCDSWEFSHRCRHSWSLIRDSIREDTHAAFDKWLAHQQYSKPQFLPTDAVITDRCAEETLLVHIDYGPMGWKLFDFIPQTVKRIFIVGNPMETHSACLLLRNATMSYLRELRPGVEVSFSGGEVWEDFLKIIYAPVLIRQWTSSFGLWAALASYGEVWSGPINHCWMHKPLASDLPKNYQKQYSCSVYDLGDDWHFVDTSVLLPTGKAFQAAPSMNRSPWSLDKTHHDGIRPARNLSDVIKWLKTH